MKGEVSNRNSCYHRAEPLLQRTKCCPSRWAQPAQRPPASPGADPAPAQGILLSAQTPRAVLKDSSPLSGVLLHSPLLSYRHHHSLLLLEQALESTSVPALPVRVPEGSHCSRKAQQTYQQDQEALRSFVYL